MKRFNYKRNGKITIIKISLELNVTKVARNRVGQEWSGGGGVVSTVEATNAAAPVVLKNFVMGCEKYGVCSAFLDCVRVDAPSANL